VGATVSSALRKAQQVAIPDGIVLVEIGGNDLLGSTTVDDFRRDLEALLAHLTGPDRQIIMFELPLPPFCNGYGRVQRRLAAKHDVALIPKRVFLRVLAADNATLDSIHLSQHGHELMADSVWQVLQHGLAN
jgi:acyl-CoA thioesterase-1